MNVSGKRAPEVGTGKLVGMLLYLAHLFILYRAWQPDLAME